MAKVCTIQKGVLVCLAFLIPIDPLFNSHYTKRCHYIGLSFSVWTGLPVIYESRMAYTFHCSTYLLPVFREK